jgi:ABC-type antimicrobial peptide transport system permease subunit
MTYILAVKRKQKIWKRVTENTISTIRVIRILEKNRKASIDGRKIFKYLKQYVFSELITDMIPQTQELQSRLIQKSYSPTKKIPGQDNLIIRD